MKIMHASECHPKGSPDGVPWHTRVRAAGVTIEASFQLKKACPLNTTLLCEASVKSVQSDGLRVHTEGIIKHPDGTVYAIAKAQLVDYGRIRRDTNTLSPHLQ